MFCGKCGAKVLEGYEFCMRCGTRINTSDTISAESIVEEKKSEKKFLNKKMFTIVTAGLVIVLMVIVVVSGLMGVDEKNGYFANIPWGTDIETVKKKFDQTFKFESVISLERDSVAAIIENYDGMEGVSVGYILYCKDNESLSSVAVVFGAEDESRYTVEKIADELIEKYNKLFGKSNEVAGYIHSHSWTTANSIIRLDILSEKIIMLVFEKNNFKD